MLFYYNMANTPDTYGNSKKTSLAAYYTLVKLFAFLQTEEFQKELDCELDFYVTQSIVSMHLWLICQRLQNFRRSKLADEITFDILKLYKDLCKYEFEKNVDTLRKLKKFRTTEELYEDQKNRLHWFFYINNPTVENNYFKIDSFVWRNIYREKIDRYDDRVYKMSHYLIHHFNKLKEYNYSDFECLNFNFSTDCIPLNYRDRIEQYNPRLDQETYFIEKYSDYKYKLFSYNYQTPPERDNNESLKTYTRYHEHETKDTENMLLKSSRKEDMEYDYLKDEDKKGKFKDQLNLMKIKDETGSILVSGIQSLSKKWIQKFLGDNIDQCKIEDENRKKRQGYNDFRYLAPGIKRFSEKLDEQTKSALYEYRYNLVNHKESETEFYIYKETKVFYPDAVLITNRQKKKPLVEKIFKV